MQRQTNILIIDDEQIMRMAVPASVQERVDGDYV